MRDKALQSQPTGTSIAQMTSQLEHIDWQSDMRQSLILRRGTSRGGMYSNDNNENGATTSSRNHESKAQNHGQDSRNSLCYRLLQNDKVCVDCSQQLQGFPEQPATSLLEHADIDHIFDQESLNPGWFDFSPDLTGPGINRSNYFEYPSSKSLPHLSRYQ